MTDCIYTQNSLMTTLVIQLYVVNLKLIQFVRNQKFQTEI